MAVGALLGNRGFLVLTASAVGFMVAQVALMSFLMPYLVLGACAVIAIGRTCVGWNGLDVRLVTQAAGEGRAGQPWAPRSTRCR